MKRVIVLSVVALLAAFFAFLVLNGKPVRAIRVQFALGRMPELHHKQTFWKGDTLVVEGTVETSHDYDVISRRLATIVGAGNLVNRAIVVWPETPIAPAELGSVTVAVNTDYNDSDDSLKQIAAIVQLPQFEIYKAAANQTLSGIILDRYRLGPSDLPRTYAMLSQRIQALNNVTNPDAIAEGPLKIPIVPPRVQRIVSVGTAPHIGFGHFSIFPGISITVPTGLRPAVPPEAVFTAPPQGIAVVPTPSIPPIRAVQNPTFILSVPVTSSNAASTQSSLAAFSAQTKSEKLTVSFAAPPSQSSVVHLTMSSDDEAALASALNQRPRRNTTLFILDDAWPDADTYSTSIKELQKMSDTVRGAIGLAPIDFKTAPFVPLPQPLHSSYIRDSLKEFTDRDRSSIVKVVYIPLSKAQNSSAVLSELLRLHFAITMSTSTASSDIQAAMEKWASDVLSNVQADYSDQKISTDWAIIEAIWSIADFIALRSPNRDVFFINESWTVLPGTVNVSHSGVSAGIVVAAAGNTLGKVVNSDIGGVDFARQCTSTRSVIAALNVTPHQGLICNSSIVEEQLLNDTFVAAYDGEVLGGPDERKCLEGDVGNCVCGTSFSAPRIAWMLALSEAVRSTDVEYSNWNVVLQNKVRGLRRNSATPWVGEYLSVSDLMKTR